MWLTQDLTSILRGGVLAVLAAVTAYHLVRVVRVVRPVRCPPPAAPRATPLDAAHALMGVVMLLMVVGRIGHDTGLAWAGVFVVLGAAGAFGAVGQRRVELVTGSAAMVVMLAVIPSTSTTPMAGTAAMARGSGGPVIRFLVGAVILGLLVAEANDLLRARTRLPGTGDRGPRGWPVACRVGLNLATVYMLALSV